MKRSLALAVCGFSLVLALVGGWLADRQFTAALDTLADQAVLQHQRNLFGYADTLQEVKADDSPHMILADDSGTRYVNASDKAFAGQLYTCIFYSDAAGVEQLQLTYCSATPEEVASPENALTLDATIFISYLPNNGPILSMTISYDDLPESTVDLETLQDRFCDQLKLTVPGEWTDIGGGQRNYSSSNLVTLVDACTATNRGVMMSAFLNPFV